MSRIRQTPRRRRLASIALPIAATLALGAGLVACGDDDDDDGAGDATQATTPDDGAAADGEITVDLAPLNDSGVSGTATLTPMEDQLMVTIDVEGLEADQPHAQHLHQPEDGSPASCPTEDADGDGDGVVTLEEGLPSYGPVVLPLEPFPTADADGAISYEQTVMLPPAAEPLENDALVLHGASVDGEFVATLPVACVTLSG